MTDLTHSCLKIEAEISYYILDEEYALELKNSNAIFFTSEL